MILRTYILQKRMVKRINSTLWVIELLDEYMHPKSGKC